MTWQPNPFWTEAKLAECRRLYVVEGRTAEETARLIGAPSRSSVISKARRSGWMLPESRINGRGSCVRQDRCSEERRERENRMQRERRAQAIKPPRPPKAIRPPPAPKPDPLNPTEFIMVGNDGGKEGRLPRMDGNLPSDSDPIAFRFRPVSRCSWPIGPVEEIATADSSVCGAPVAEEFCPYCPVHVRQSRSGRPLQPLKGFRDLNVATVPMRKAA